MVSCMDFEVEANCDVPVVLSTTKVLLVALPTNLWVRGHEVCLFISKHLIWEILLIGIMHVSPTYP